MVKYGCRDLAKASLQLFLIVPDGSCTIFWCPSVSVSPGHKRLYRRVQTLRNGQTNLKPIWQKIPVGTRSEFICDALEVLQSLDFFIIWKKSFFPCYGFLVFWALVWTSFSAPSRPPFCCPSEDHPGVGVFWICSALSLAEVLWP